MNRRMTLIAVAALTIGIILGGGMIALAASPSEQRMPGWNYVVVACPSIDAQAAPTGTGTMYTDLGPGLFAEDCVDMLLSLGEDGFELVSVVHDGENLLHYFKRPL